MALTIYRNPQFVKDLKRQDQLSGFMCILGFGTSTPSASFNHGGDSKPFMADTIILTQPTATSVTFQISMRVAESPDENYLSKYHEAYLYYVNHDMRPGLTLASLRGEDNFPVNVRKANIAYKLHWSNEDYTFMLNEIVNLTEDLSDAYSNAYPMSADKFECLSASKHHDVEHINTQWYGEQMGTELMANDTAMSLVRDRLESKETVNLRGSIYYGNNGIIKF